MDTARLKKDVAAEVDLHRDELGCLARELHEHPETAFEEVRSRDAIVKLLGNSGFTVENGICDLPTAFKAVYGSGSPVIAFLAEYDALPVVGHACGHNLIATASTAAGIAARKAVDGAGGTIVVFGTPGEEIYGGKSIMAERGAFEGTDFAMITHPGAGNAVLMNTLACETLEVEFFGRAAHAAAEPESGINALEALILSYNAVNSLRQHLREKARVHGVITSGGEAANVVPAYTSASFIVRADSDEYLEEVKKKVIDCFTGASLATGARLKYRWGEHYAAMRSNVALARLFKQNMETLGRRVSLGDNAIKAFSTDVGNVSRIVPTIQPLVAIAPDNIQLHTPEFAAAAASPEGLAALLDAARAMAMTAVDILGAPGAAEEIRNEFLGAG